MSHAKQKVRQMAYEMQNQKFIPACATARSDHSLCMDPKMFRYKARLRFASDFTTLFSTLKIALNLFKTFKSLNYGTFPVFFTFSVSYD